MKDYACERLYRDARITSIYEGTTQLQVVAAIRHVTTGTYKQLMDQYAAVEVAESLKPVRQTIMELVKIYDDTVNKVNEVKDTTYLDFVARRLVEMAGNIVMSFLLLTDTNREGGEMFRRSLEVYVKMAQAEVMKHYDFISNFRPEQVDLYKAD